MKVGQTLALAGLVQTKLDSTMSGIPWLMDLPVVGVPFRKTSETINEVELLIMVTPQYISGVDPSEVPPCGPGSSSQSPGDWDFYMRGHMEVPACNQCGVGYDCQACNNQVGPGGIVLPGMPQPSTGPAIAPQGEVIPPGATSRAGQTSPYMVNRQAPPPNGQQVVNNGGRGPMLPSQQVQYEGGQRATVGDIPRTATRPGPTQNTGFIGPLGYDAP
jgi:pilus assembly protein CpaC